MANHVSIYSYLNVAVTCPNSKWFRGELTKRQAGLATLNRTNVGVYKAITD